MLSPVLDKKLLFSKFFWTNGSLDQWIDEKMNEWIDGCMDMDSYLNGWEDRWPNGIDE